MTWIRLDDKFWRNEKARRVSHAARGVFADCLSFCGDVPAAALTGFLTDRQARDRATGSPRLIHQLVQEGFLEPVNGGYLIHDFDHYVPKTSRERTRAWRERKRSECHEPVTRDVTVTPPLPRAHDGRPEPDPVPVASKAPLLHIALPEVVPFEEQPETKLAVWWQEFNGGRISEYDKQAAAAFVVDYPRLGLAGIQARIAEHAQWRRENEKKPLGRLEFYRDTLNDQEEHLADSGVTRPRAGVVT